MDYTDPSHQPPPLPPESSAPVGFGQSLAPRGLGALVSDSFALAKANGALIVSIVALGLIPGYILSGSAAALTGIADKNGIKTAVEAGRWASLGLLFASGVITKLIETIANLALMSGLDARARDEDVDVGRAFSASTGSFGPFLAAEIRVALWVILGLILLIVPGIYWAVMYSLVPMAVVLEGRRGADALARSKQIMGRYGLKIIGNLVVMVLVCVLVIVAFSLLIGVAAGLTGAVGDNAPLSTKLLMNFVTEFLGQVIASATVAAGVLLFRDCAAAVDQPAA